MKILVLPKFRLHVHLPMNDVKVSLLLYPAKLHIVNRYSFLRFRSLNDTFIGSVNQWVYRTSNRSNLREIARETRSVQLAFYSPCRNIKSYP